MKKPFFFTLAFVLFSGLQAFGMDYTIELTDDWGDGWNGGSIDVLVNGSVVLDDITLETGSETSYTFSVNPGDEIETEYTAGSYSIENAYQIKNEDGDVVAESGQNGTPGNVSYTVPGLSNPDPADNAVEVNVTATTLDWDYAAPADSYTIDIGTSAGASDIVDGAATNQSQYTYDTNWNYSTQYFWTVTAISGGSAEDSEQWSFTIHSVLINCA